MHIAPKPDNWAKALHAADSKEDHLRLAEHYDDVAKTLEAEAVEAQEMLNEYHARPWRHGKRILDLKSQAAKMVRDLEKSTEDSRVMADYHRQMAEEAP